MRIYDDSGPLNGAQTHIDMYELGLDGTLQTAITNWPAKERAMKGASAWNLGGRSIVLNGGTVATDSNLQGSVSVSSIAFNAGDRKFGGPIGRMAFWTYRLPDATLQSLTT